MNFMKKLLNIKIYIIVSALVIIISGLMIFFSITRKKEVYKFLSILESYYLEEDYPTLNIDLYSNHIKDYYLNKETISNLSLKSRTSSDSYVLELKQLVEEKDVLDYNNTNYYKYRLNVSFPIELESEYQIKDAYIEINYFSNETIKLDIGSIIFYKKTIDTKLSIPCMKPVVNIINDKQMMTGLGLTLYSEDNLIINEIKSLDSRLFIKGNQITTIENNEYDNNVNIESLINQTYNPVDITNDKYNLILEKGINKHYIFPIGYEKIESINTIGFLIFYEIDGIQYQQLIYPFKYFSGLINVKEEIYVSNSNK